VLFNELLSLRQSVTPAHKWIIADRQPTKYLPIPQYFAGKTLI
jgi:hypothetical protein